MDGSCKEYPTPRHFSRQPSMPLLLVLWNNIFDAHLPLKCDIHNSNAMNDVQFLCNLQIGQVGPPQPGARPAGGPGPVTAVVGQTSGPPPQPAGPPPPPVVSMVAMSVPPPPVITMASLPVSSQSFVNSVSPMYF